MAHQAVSDLAQLPDREDALDRAASSNVDVLVIGGGITGVGVALDAAARGLSVVLVERADLASGTSSKSSKLIHGGVRYLAQHEFGLVYEAAREREVLRVTAPHLARPLKFVVPVADRVTQAQLKAGLTLYDGMVAFQNVARHERMDVGGVLDAAPGLVHGLGLGGYAYYDCQTDDARLVLAVAQAARRQGALVITHVEVSDLLRFGDRVVGASVRDGLSGRELDITARVVVSASGIWADRIRQLSTDSRGDLLTPSKGVHLAFDRAQVAVNSAVVIPSGADDGRLAFIIPWGQQAYVGTTDDLYEGDLDHPHVEPPGAGYLLHAVNQAFDLKLTIGDAVGAWAGLRPLLRGDGDFEAKDLSRKHAIFEDPPGLLTITGGKLTTYRRMAADVVDRIARDLGGYNRRDRMITRRLALGARGTPEHGLDRAGVACRMFGIDPELAGSLYHRHGDDAPAVAQFCAAHNATERLVPSLPYVTGEVLWAVKYELARTVDDVLRRRMRVALRHRDAGGEAVGQVARVMAKRLGWNRGTKKAEVESYLTDVRRERGVVPLPQTTHSTQYVLDRVGTEA